MSALRPDPEPARIGTGFSGRHADRTGDHARSLVRTRTATGAQARQRPLLVSRKAAAKPALPRSMEAVAQIVEKRLLAQRWDGDDGLPVIAWRCPREARFWADSSTVVPRLIDAPLCGPVCAT